MRALRLGLAAAACCLMVTPAVSEAHECRHPLGNVVMSPYGDLNGSGTTNVADAVCGMLAVLAQATGGSMPACLAPAVAAVGADIDCDGNISTADVVLVITVGLGQPLSSAIDASQDGCPDACAPCVPPEGTSCFIEGVCRPEGELDLAADCLACAPALSASGWSVAPELSPCGGGELRCVDGQCVVVPPAAPAAPSAEPADGRAQVSFSAPAETGGAAILEYEVEASPGGATASGVGSPLLVSGLDNGVAYTFRVRARNASGWSDFSAPSPPATPLVCLGEVDGAPCDDGGGCGLAASCQAEVCVPPPACDGACPTGDCPVSVQSYSMFNGSTGSFTYWDHTYNGSGDPTQSGSWLSGGTGDLTDGVVATQPWDVTPQLYVGWTVDPEIQFYFPGLVRLHEVVVHFDSALGHGSVWPPSALTLTWGGGSSTVAAPEPTSAAPYSAAIPLSPPILVDSATLQVTRSGQWVMVSEVQFFGDPSPTLGSGASCLGILGASPAADSGAYWIDLDGAQADPVLVHCDMTTDGGGWLDLVATMHLAPNDPQALLDRFFVTNGVNGTQITAGIGHHTSTGVPGFYILNSQYSTHHNQGFHLVGEPFGLSAVRMSYRMQGAQNDSNRCATANWIPLNGPGYNGGFNGYLSPCPSGWMCIQGTPTSGRDLPIAASYSSDTWSAATTLLTWSMSVTTALSDSCARDPEIPTSHPATFFTQLLLR